MAAAPAPRAGAADFDFLLGDWRVRHRKLRTRLAGDDRWAEFGGSMRAVPILSGAGNFDENVIEDPKGSYRACTVRMYDPVRAQWSIYWIDGRDPKPDPPVVGGFQDGVGTFVGDDFLDGRPIRVRFFWVVIGATAARWEQAFSLDDGLRWEVNWVMDFERR
jgi:hypothetical protein